MNKQELLQLINDMPDDMFALPVEYTECKQRIGEWESTGSVTSIGSVYQRSVENELVLRLKFNTRYEGEFRRKYNDPDGTFYNLRRIK